MPHLTRRHGHAVDWPLAYDDLAPYYCQAERLLATRGHAPVEGAEPPRTCAYPERKDDGYDAPSLSAEGRALPFFPVASARDGFGAPLPDLRMSFSERDRRTFERGRQALEGLSPDFEERKCHWHPSGTCRMGADERSGVVDPNGRVFGVENLYVSGACTFPTAGTANPTNTVVAPTLRLADHLIDLERAGRAG